MRAVWRMCREKKIPTNLLSLGGGRLASSEACLSGSRIQIATRPPVVFCCENRAKGLSDCHKACERAKNLQMVTGLARSSRDDVMRALAVIDPSFPKMPRRPPLAV